MGPLRGLRTAENESGQGCDLAPKFFELYSVFQSTTTNNIDPNGSNIIQKEPVLPAAALLRLKHLENLRMAKIVKIFTPAQLRTPQSYDITSKISSHLSGIPGDTTNQHRT